MLLIQAIKLKHFDFRASAATLSAVARWCVLDCWLKDRAMPRPGAFKTKAFFCFSLVVLALRCAAAAPAASWHCIALRGSRAFIRVRPLAHAVEKALRHLVMWRITCCSVCTTTKSSIRYGETLENQGVIKGKPVGSGDLALLLCESQEVWVVR